MSKTDGDSPVVDISLFILVLTLAVVGQVFGRAGAAADEPAVLYSVSYTAFLARGALWAVLLRRHPVSRIYPFLTLSYPLVLMADCILFGTDITQGNITGTILIVAGTLIMITDRKP